jgi:hypothetical protein
MPADISVKELNLIKQELNHKSMNSDFNCYLVENKNLKVILEKFNFKMNDLLTKCYILNENVEPNIYELTNIADQIVLPSVLNIDINDELLINYCSGKLDKLCKDIEWEIKLQLHALMRKVAKDLKDFTELERDGYFVSVTEKEVLKGVLTYEKYASKTCIFFRDIEGKDSIDLKEKTQVELARRFFDMKGSKRDEESELLIKELRAKCETKLSNTSNNMFVLAPVKWSVKTGISYADHKEHVENFGEKFEQVVLNLIQLNNSQEKYYLNHLVDKNNYENFVNEIVQQSAFRVKYGSFFVARNEEKKAVNFFSFFLCYFYLKSLSNTK